MSENVFTNIEENVSLFMKTIYPKLKIMHDAGLAHRDIKASNFVMDLDEGKSIPVVFDMIDFDQCGEPSDHTKRIVGTSMYAPPAAVACEEGFKLTAKYDIFGLGISLIEMITFKHPIKERDGYPRNYDNNTQVQEHEVDDNLDEFLLICIIL